MILSSKKRRMGCFRQYLSHPTFASCLIMIDYTRKDKSPENGNESRKGKCHQDDEGIIKVRLEAIYDVVWRLAGRGFERMKENRGSGRGRIGFEDKSFEIDS